MKTWDWWIVGTCLILLCLVTVGLAGDKVVPPVVPVTTLVKAPVAPVVAAEPSDDQIMSLQAQRLAERKQKTSNEIAKVLQANGMVLRLGVAAVEDPPGSGKFTLVGTAAVVDAKTGQ